MIYDTILEYIWILLFSRNDTFLVKSMTIMSKEKEEKRQRQLFIDNLEKWQSAVTEGYFPPREH